MKTRIIFSKTLAKNHPFLGEGSDSLTLAVNRHRYYDKEVKRGHTPLP